MKTKIDYFRMITTYVLVSAIFCLYFFIIFRGDVQHNILFYSCVGAAFVLSVIFIRFGNKNSLLTIALALALVADFFLVLDISKISSEKAKLIGLCIFCGVQFMFILFTILLSKGNGVRVVNIGIRVALCLLAYYVMGRYYTLDTLQWIYVMYLINSAFTIFTLLFHMKNNWVLFLGLLLLLACDIVIGFVNGGFEIFGMTGGPFVKFLTGKLDVAFICYIPALILISLASVWTNIKGKEE